MLSNLCDGIDNAIIKAQVWKGKMVDRIKDSMNKKVDGIAVIELAMIMFVVIILVILFRKQLVALSESLFSKAGTKAANVYEDASNPATPSL